jgi:hypothetical protein
MCTGAVALFVCPQTTKRATCLLTSTMDLVPTGPHIPLRLDLAQEMDQHIACRLMIPMTSEQLCQHAALSDNASSVADDTNKRSDTLFEESQRNAPFTV